MFVERCVRAVLFSAKVWELAFVTDAATERPNVCSCPILVSRCTYALLVVPASSTSLSGLAELFSVSMVAVRPKFWDICLSVYLVLVRPTTGKIALSL